MSTASNSVESARLTFADEFNTFSPWTGSGGTWDTTYWWVQPNQAGYPSPNQELQWYINTNYGPTSGVNPFSIDDGVLTITAERADASIKPLIQGRDYTSGTITSYHSHTQTYGYFEMRADLPEGQGYWPAFWLMPANGSHPPELDIMEVLGHDTDRLYTTLHSGSTGTMTSKTGTFDTGVDMADGFHTYAVDWQPDTITWYFDDKKIYEVATPSDMHQDMYMIANLAVGGGWPGSPDGTTPFPGELKIDYIRAYTSKPDASTPAPTDPPPAPAEPPPATDPDGSAGPGPSPTDPDPTDPPPVASGPDTPAPEPNEPDTPAPDPTDNTPPQQPDRAPFTLAESADWETSMVGTRRSDRLAGDDGHNRLDGLRGRDIMTGRDGDDSYFVDGFDRVIEFADEGTDTVHSTASRFVLPDNVENLVLEGRWQTGVGNALDNTIWANEHRSTLNGGGGDDMLIAGAGRATMTGGAGSDLFVFETDHGGRHRVTDFEIGRDMIDMRTLFAETGYAGSDPLADGHLAFLGNGRGGTNLVFDADGTGGDSGEVLAVLDHVEPAALTLQSDVWFR